MRLSRFRGLIDLGVVRRAENEFTSSIKIDATAERLS
jgi:hypothetical protein